MITLKAIKDFSLNGVFYEEGDEVVIDSIKDVVRLNEKGFIEPLNAKDIQNIKKELERPKKNVEFEEE